ncbi:SMI1/KNR4 family protein [Paenibacillus sp. LjRoot153]|uniref:SMI1/KNR4 family protein n=1 Tax=Paenibacillus sp. LjRoot153 TaxID=3342270 RepID=UPI003ECEF48C
MNKIIEVLPPPNSPYNSGDEFQWGNFINTIGTNLPSDYKQFVINYGTGGIDSFLWILNPFVKDENINFLKKKKELSDAYLQSKLNFPMYFKHEVFPSNCGILPWGYTDNGDELYWLTVGEPDTWEIIVYTSRSSEYFSYPVSMSEFLYQVITKDLICGSFPDDFPKKVTEFISIDIE